MCRSLSELSGEANGRDPTEIPVVEDDAMGEEVNFPSGDGLEISGDELGSLKNLDLNVEVMEGEEQSPPPRPPRRTPQTCRRSLCKGTSPSRESPARMQSTPLLTLDSASTNLVKSLILYFPVRILRGR